MPTIVSPIDGRTAGEYSLLDTQSALARVDRAKHAQRTLQSLSLNDRIQLVQRALAAYEVQVESNAALITRMMGKPLEQARQEFLGGTRSRALHLCGVAARALGERVLPAEEGIERFIRHEPVGVVLDIAAWNYPLLITVNVIVPAVLAGNAVLIKHAHQTALVAEQWALAFREAGAPEGLVEALHVDHATAAQLIDSRRFGYVSFTGSVRGGREVYRTVARENFIGVGLELGGKDGALVLADADLEFTVDNLVDGAFYNAGQSCCAVERIYVEAPLYDRFVEAFAARAHQYVVGDPFDPATSLGPLVNEAAAQHVNMQVAQALAQGAHQVTDAGRFSVPDTTACYLAPQVLVDVDHQMELMRDETFGPAIGIMKVRDAEEGITLINDSRYGLTGSLWTQDAVRGAALAERVQAGTVFLNRCDYLDPGLAWTGVKDSGFGCSLSELAFLQVTRPKSYHLRKRGGS